MAMSRIWACLALVGVLACGRSVLETNTNQTRAAARILTLRVADASVGEVYRATLLGEGPGALSWALESGRLPAGLELVPAGDQATIEGRPLTPETASFGVRLSAENGATDVVEYTIIVVAGGQLEITTRTLPAANVRVPYETTIRAFGGVGGRTWTVFQSALQAGLQLQPMGDDVRIEGVPLETGLRMIGIRVEDTAGNVAERIFGFRVGSNEEPLRVVPDVLPPGIIRESYGYDIAAVGGVPPYSWATVEGSLPPGMSLGVSGTPSTTLTGRPIRAGVYDFVVEVVDSQSNTAQQAFTIDVFEADRLEILTTSLPDGMVFESYVRDIDATPGFAPYRWSVIGGALPDRCMLANVTQASVGIIGGPQIAGPSTFELEVIDNLGRRARRTFDVTINDVADPLRVVTTGIPAGEVGAAYTAMVTAAGGQAPYTWSIGGSLPGGMVFDAAGTPSTRLSGTPGQVGSFDFVVTVEGQTGVTATRMISWDVLPSGASLQIDTTTLPATELCTEYDAAIEASGGSRAGYTWSVVQGSLPPGLTLDTSGTPSARIRGVATMSGSFAVTVQVQDSDMGLTTRTLVVQVTTTSGPRFGLVGGDTTNNGTREIYAINLCTPSPTSGGRINQIGGGNEGLHAHLDALSMSPTGDRAAYSGQQNGTTGVFIVDLRGAAPTIVPVGPTQSNASVRAYPIWSPDGTKLAFRADLEVSNRFDLYVVDVRDPSNPGPARRAHSTTVPQGDVMSEMSWSPDSRYIAFTGDIATDNLLELWVAEVFTSSVSTRAVTGMLSVAQDVLNFEPAWNASSTGVAFAGVLRGARRELFFVDVTQAAPSPVPFRPGNTAFATILQYFVSPNRRWIAYISDETLSGTFELYRVDLDDPLLRPVTISGTFPANRRVLRVDWNHGSTALVYTSNTNPSFQGELYLARVTSPGIVERLDQTTMNGGGVRSFAESVVWTPDDDGVVYLVDPTTRGRYEPFYVDLGVSPPSAPVRIGQHTIRSNTRVLKFARDVPQLFMVIEPPNSGLRELYRADLENGASSTTVLMSGTNPVFSVPATPGLVAPRPRATSVFFALGSSFAPNGRPFVATLGGTAPTSLAPTSFTARAFNLP